MHKKKMDSRKIFTLESSNELFRSKQGYYWFAGTWFALMLWAYLQSSFTVLVGPVVITIIVLIASSKYLKQKIDIVISDDALSIHENGATLWRTSLRDITSIDLEEKSFFQLGARKALIIRNSKNDSFYQALDGMNFGKFEAFEVINELRALSNKNA
ncbi:MAG: hypothetical protein K1564_04685 [Candidatus Thiodiazotropha sp. (ex. Lucinisca nassula)]|nr:hypothetical protein [Candidatus Thiodiazotropha sp. (ex. Lucinisca nassula)]